MNGIKPIIHEKQGARNMQEVIWSCCDFIVDEDENCSVMGDWGVMRMTDPGSS
jgi:hypothetical protein